VAGGGIEPPTLDTLSVKVHSPGKSIIKNVVDHQYRYDYMAFVGAVISYE